MKDEIKEILDNLVVNETTGMCYLSIKLTKQIKDCITNLQEENEEYKRLMSNIDMNSVDYVYNKDTKLYTFDRKNWYKINKKLDERFNCKQRIDKAIKILNEGLKELDTRDRNEVYSEEYLENALDVLKRKERNFTKEELEAEENYYKRHQVPFKENYEDYYK